MVKPITAYKWFLKKGGNKDKWTNLSDKEKTEYILLAKKDRERYISENPKDFKFLKVIELKILCRNNNLKISGKKADLIERLKNTRAKIISKKADLIERLKNTKIEYDITQTVKEKIDSILN